MKYKNPKTDGTFKSDLYARCFASMCEESKCESQSVMEPRDQGFANLDNRDLPEY